MSAIARQANNRLIRRDLELASHVKKVIVARRECIIGRCDAFEFGVKCDVVFEYDDPLQLVVNDMA
jgi:hypothetical protein